MNHAFPVHPALDAMPKRIVQPTTITDRESVGLDLLDKIFTDVLIL